MKKVKSSSSSSMDRISQLPEAVLHHILYFLSQHDAARTCVLSKAWRWTWSTRPNVEFVFNLFKGQKELRSLVNKTLQVYHDRKLCIEEFALEIETKTCESEWCSLLDKWIPIVMHMGGINKFRLCIYNNHSHHYDLPPSVIEAQSLEDLYLLHCNLYQVKAPNHSLHLKKLSLLRSYIMDESLQNIISNCPLIEDIRIERCALLVYTAINVNKCHNLKNFSLSTRVHSNSFEINEAPNLETLCIDGRGSWVVDHHHVLHNLKSLTLKGIRLSSKSFDYLSCNLPSLEKLIIFHCYGCGEFQLRSKTIRHFECATDMSLKATIDAPNMLYFQYQGNFIPSFSFTTISSDCKSNISIGLRPLVHDVSLWFLKLKEMLEALRNSEISLHFHLLNQNHEQINEQIENVLLVLNFEVPQSQIVIECVHFTQCVSISSPLVNALFRIFRPMKIEHCCFLVGVALDRMKNDRVAEFLWKSLMERDNIPNEELIFWQQDLEEVSMQTFDKSQQKWIPFQGKSWSECAVFQRIRFQLKWREASLKLI